MSVAPRPGVEDDPFLALTRALSCVIFFAAVRWMTPPAFALVVTLPIAIAAAGLAALPNRLVRSPAPTRKAASRGAAAPCARPARTALARGALTIR